MMAISFHDSDRAGYPIWDDRNHNDPCSLTVRQCHIATQQLNFVHLFIKLVTFRQRKPNWQLY